MFLIILFCYVGAVAFLLQNFERFTRLFGNVLPECFEGENESKRGFDDHNRTIDQFDKNNYLPIDYAWESKDYRKVLLLLQKDSLFPRKFDLESLDDKVEDQKKLKDFVEERILLHQLIEKDDLDGIKVLTSGKKSKYFFNYQDYSAAFVAVRNKNFRIYSYLVSIGADYDENERNLEDEWNFDKLDKDEISLIEEIKSEHARKNHKYYIFDLNSKCKIKSSNKSDNEAQNNEAQKYINNLFEELDKIEEMSIIFKVVVDANDLEIRFNFDSGNVKDDCLAPVDANGLVIPDKHKIFIGVGKKSLREVEGTLAQELTHLGMELIFHNNYNPYFESDITSKEKLQEISDFIDKNINKDYENPSIILKSALNENYREKNHEHGELIARIPHILAQFGENGREWLVTLGETMEKNKVTNLLKFYKENVVRECEKFINEKFKKARKYIKQLNESKGEMSNIKRKHLLLKDISPTEAFLNSENKNIFLLKTNNTFLGLLKILQAYDVNYIKSYDSFLVFQLDKCIDSLDNIKKGFYSIPCDMLIIQCLNYSKVIEKILKFDNKNKKIVFIMKEHHVKSFEKIAEDLELNDSFIQEKDEDFDLGDLKVESKEMILSKDIIFQGTQMTLKDFLNNREDLFKYVNADLMEKLIHGEKIEIGSKPFGTSSLEGAYADICQEVNLAALNHEIKYSKDFFIINIGQNQKSDIVKLLGENFDEALMGELEKYNLAISGNKKVFLSNNEVTDDNFKTFCSYNSHKKIYWIRSEMFQQKLILEKLYNPDFYFKRKFKHIKKKSISKKLISNDQNLYSDFLIFPEGDSRIPKSNSEHVQWLDSEKVNSKFEELCKLNANVHLVKSENDELIWIRSHGSLNEIRKYTDKNLSKEMKAVENKLLSIIRDEKVVIFADEPGMGKTTAITKLYEIIQNSIKLAANHWVMRINLKDHLNSIKKINENLNIHEIVNFLQRIDSISRFTKAMEKDLLISVLDKNKTFQMQLLIAFDGFDELLDENDRNKMIKLFKFLKNNTNCRIWITTRLNFREALENELSTFAVTFVPINDTSKQEFIKNYFKDRLRLILDQKTFSNLFECYEESVLQKYTSNFINKARSIFKKDIRFIGTPLQLHLLLENSIESFQDWITNPIGNPPFSYLGNNIFEVYTRFLDRKFEIFYKKKNILETSVRSLITDSLQNYHEGLAKALVLKEEIPREITKHSPLLLLVGILKAGGENLKFSHLTFREFFFAQMINNALVKGFKLPEMRTFFFQTILLDDKYQMIRSFLNEYFKINDTREISRSFDSSVIFDSWFLQEGTNKCGFCVAIMERHDHILQFLFSIEFNNREWLQLLKHENSCGKPVLILAIESINNFAFDLITSITFPNEISKVDLDQQYNYLTIANDEGETALHCAISFENKHAINKILEFASNRFSSVQQYEYLTIANEKGNTALHCAISFENKHAIKKILEFASRFSPVQQYEYLTIANKKGKTALHCAISSRRDYAINQILEFASNRFSPVQQYEYLTIANEKGNTALHCAMSFKNQQAINKILEFASNRFSPVQQYEFSTIANKKGKTALHCGISSRRDYTMNQILEFASNRFSSDNQFKLLMIPNDKDETVIELAITKECDDGNLNRIFEIISKLSPDQQCELLICGNNNKGTILHLATEKGDDYALEKILKIVSDFSLDMQSQYLTKKDYIYGTVLQLAIWSNNDYAFEKIINDFVCNLSSNQIYELLVITDAFGETVFDVAKEEICNEPFLESLKKAINCLDREHFESLPSDVFELLQINVN